MIRPASASKAGFLVLLCVGMFSCTTPTNQTTGGITFSIGESISKTLIPALSMTPTTYVVTGSGPSSATFTKTLSGTTNGTADSLAIGDWTVTVEAKNVDGILIGVGTGSATVTAGATASVSVTVIPYDGTGTLTLSLSWTPTDVGSPVVEASLLPSTGTARALTFTVDTVAGVATFTANDVPAGYHTLTLVLKDGSSVASGTVEVVRIVKGQSTSGTFLFDKVNKAPFGSISANITPSMADPLTLVISGSSAVKAQNQTQTLTASVSNYSDNLTCVWYVNGSSVGTGATFAFDSSFAIGNYNISATAYSADGKRAGSTSSSIAVTAPFIVTQSYSGDRYSLLTRDDGSLWSMGLGYMGALGDGTYDSHPIPICVEHTGVVLASASPSHAMYVKADGSLWGMGDNRYGALGDGTTTNRPTPIEVMSSGVESVSCGEMYTLVVMQDGRLLGMGNNADGQLGIGETSQALVPTVALPSGVASASAGSSHSMVIMSDSSLWASGWNALGTFGNGTTIGARQFVMVLSAGAKKVASEDTATLVLMADGRLLGAGDNFYGQLGTGNNTRQPLFTPVYSSGVRDVSSGGYHAMVLLDDGRVFSFGRNDNGQLGVGNFTNTNSPTLVFQSGVTVVDAGYQSSNVVKSDGSLWSVGSYIWGTNGNITQSDRSTFAVVQTP